MAFDPRFFHAMVVTDTCAVWNTLSSEKVYRCACFAGIVFCITPMVLYECIQKPRKVVTETMSEMKNRFNTARKKGGFFIESCDLDDLLAVSRNAPLALSSGELSCIAVAYKMPTLAFMTDEKKARKYAEEKLSLKVETTPRLYGWLHYQRHLLDGDHSNVIAEHEKYERRPLTKFFNEAYESALQYRLMGSA